MREQASSVQRTDDTGDAQELEVLREAVGVVADWIDRLPASSDWKYAMIVIRHEIASCVESEPPGGLRLARVA
jgi:hypothetical protein